MYTEGYPSHKEILPMRKTVLRFLAVIVIGFISGVIGLISGALIGGNYAEQFVFNGVQGYEATGQIGFILGALIGSISSWWFLVKRKSLSLSG
jgi:hypothetical protein